MVGEHKMIVSHFVYQPRKVKNSPPPPFFPVNFYNIYIFRKYDDTSHQKRPKTGVRRQRFFTIFNVSELNFIFKLFFESKCTN